MNRLIPPRRLMKFPRFNGQNIFSQLRIRTITNITNNNATQNITHNNSSNHQNQSNSNNSNNSSSNNSSSSDSKTNNNNSNNNNNRKPGFPYKITLFSLSAFYYYLRWSNRNESLIDSLNSFINLSEDESMELLVKTRLSESDFEELYDSLLYQYPTGLLTIDQFASSALKIVKKADEREKLEFQERNSARELIKQNNPKAKVDGDDETDPAAATADATRSNTLDALDFLPLLRFSPKVKANFYDVREMLVALAILLDQRIPIPVAESSSNGWRSYFTLASACVRPEIRLRFLFRLTDEDRDGKLNFSQFAKLLERMERTGHFNRESILVQTAILPPLFTRRDPTVIAWSFFNMKYSNKLFSSDQFNPVIDSNNPFLSVPITKPQIPSAPPSIHLYSGPEVKSNFSDPLPISVDYTKLNSPQYFLTFDEFLSISRLNSLVSDNCFWYLPPRDPITGMKLGFFKRRWNSIETKFAIQSNKFIQQMPDLYSVDAMFSV